MSHCAFLRAVMERSVTQDDMRTDHALGVVVVAGQSRGIQEGQHLFLMLQETPGESLPMFVGVRRGGKEEQSLLDAARLADIFQGRHLTLLSVKPMGVAQDAFELLIRNAIILRRVFSPAVPQLSKQMHQTLLLPATQLVVGGIKITDPEKTANRQLFLMSSTELIFATSTSS